ncbi:hypothetical protein ABPG75_004590 [Micractinium tetrahymenae]
MPVYGITAPAAAMLLLLVALAGSTAPAAASNATAAPSGDDCRDQCAGQPYAPLCASHSSDQLRRAESAFYQVYENACLFECMTQADPTAAVAEGAIGEELAWMLDEFGSDTDCQAEFKAQGYNSRWARVALDSKSAGVMLLGQPRGWGGVPQWRGAGTAA